MINVSELIIGNWLHGINTFDVKESFFQVEDIYDDQINVSFIEGYNEGCAKTEPIPLTPEILDKCGFVNRDNRYAFQPELLNIEYRLVDFHGWIFSIGFFNWNNEITTIKYLHELQNLYYAIAHEELQIKNL